MERLELLKVLCAASESTSFRGAAMKLGRSPQDITRAVQELERELGEVLFHRSTRKIQITQFGERFAMRARDALAAVDGLFDTRVSAPDSDMQGRVHITAPGAIGRRFLAPVISRLASAHPGLIIELSLSEKVADVVDERIDIGIRIGFMRDQRFVARPAARIGFEVVAAPSLIDEHARPESITDLQALPVTALMDINSGKAWPWHFKSGQQFLPHRANFITDDPETECEAVLNGMGFGQLPWYLALPHIRSGRLVPVLHAHAPDPWQICVYRPQRSPVPRRVRIVFDEIMRTLSDDTLFPQSGPSEES